MSAEEFQGWGPHHHPDRFDFRLFEAQAHIGGNAITADMPQDDGNSIPFDIAVDGCIPSVYQHILLLMKKFGIELIDTRFSDILARIHRRRASGQRPEVAKGCSSESGIMVL